MNTIGRPFVPAPGTPACEEDAMVVDQQKLTGPVRLPSSERIARYYVDPQNPGPLSDVRCQANL